MIEDGVTVLGMHVKISESTHDLYRPPPQRESADRIVSIDIDLSSCGGEVHAVLLHSMSVNA